jgi:nucleotide-binding universal stress UspA family protein
MWHPRSHHQEARPANPGQRSVLVGVDGDEGGWDALDWAAAEAATRGAALRIVHVVRLMWGVDTFSAVGVSRVAPVETAERILAEAADRARALSPEIPITTEVLPGSPARVIPAVARRDELIVLGRRRHESAHDRRSVTAEVVRRAHGRVVVVDPAPDELSRSPRRSASPAELH